MLFKTDISLHGNLIIIREEMPKSSLAWILGRHIELEESLFDITKEYGICNILGPFLNLRRYLVSIETRIKGKQPDVLAIAPDFVLGKKWFYNPIFAPIMIFEAKAKPLTSEDMTKLNEYIERYKHVFLAVNDYVLKKTDRKLKRELLKLYKAGNISFVVTYLSDNNLYLRYIINCSSLSSILHSAQVIGEEVRRELMERIREVKTRGLRLYRLRRAFIDSLHRSRTLPASLLEKALQRSRLILVFPGGKLEDIYKRGLGHLFSLITFTSVFLTSPASTSFKFPHVFSLNELFLSSIGHGVKTIDEMVRES